MANPKHGSVEGVAEVLKVLDGLKLSIANKIARPALNKAASRGAKIVKAKIPSRYKSVRKAIGWRPGKAKYNQGVVSSKVGAGVGQNKKDGGGKRTIRRATSTRDRTGRKGVGIDGRNVHWWFMGTDDRFTGTKRAKGKTFIGEARGKRITLKNRIEKGNNGQRYTGKMPAQEQPITVILNGHAAELSNILRVHIAQGITVHVQKTAWTKK